MFINEFTRCIASQDWSVFTPEQFQEDNYPRLAQELFNGVILDAFNRVAYEKVLEVETSTS